MYAWRLSLQRDKIDAWGGGKGKMQADRNISVGS